MIQNNVVVNNILWNGDVNTWTPPENATMLIDAETPALVWLVDNNIKDYVLIEVLGAGDIGFTWNGQILTTNQPKPEFVDPEANQPSTSGTQTL